jgi:hypothetical protein
VPTVAAAGPTVVAVGDAALSTIVPLMATRPWLNHVISPQVLDDKLWGLTLPGVMWRLVGGELSVAPFLGAGFHGRQVRLRDSQKREERIGMIADAAQAAGASGTIVEKIRDVAEELITNAMYDAPAETLGVQARRTERAVLPRDEAPTITYGAAHKTFFIRVVDTHGSLRRERMFEVLSRCAARGDVDIDPTTGGAGFGMWRIMSAATLAVVHVRHRQSTEFLIGIDLVRSRKSSRGRAIHLFFEGSETTVSGNVQVTK